MMWRIVLCFVPCILYIPTFGVNAMSPNYVQKLTNEVLKDYNPAARPNDLNGNIGNVTFGISPTCLNLRYYGLVFGNIWYKINWYDPRLTWNSSSGVESLSLPNDLIWKPDIVPFFGRDGTHYDSKYPVKVFPNGMVLFVPSVEFKHRCFRQTKRSARKIIRCNVEFGSWTYDSEIMNLNFFGGKASVDTSTYDFDFCPTKILQSTATRKVKKIEGYPKSYVSLIFHLKLVKRGAGKRLKGLRKKGFYKSAN
ncbi:acetylcholine receptor subunit beta-like 1 [Lepeophtheirus salmonis]|uniref:acetylcholine receptor subunit beta-like 1 n=1 Tax=Lepeophtheirus salmonis TaxID=72036 RepID=UPI00077ECE16|nr:acetylcholine receptor subunit beta-like 1 [Lepeophtheirus salmonis]XP_040568930.1 acetylcholine receptor subunit beta-like 1 [Lepeophtheirus salmonis]XP_040568931.1 acetylcholine receptor subunit beta-like 1 [Lepeophtheirus salmonis]XP_040568932.1 acetylcholine receptor subunit beta-like 1 [Lepeophtheirus salmonis]